MTYRSSIVMNDSVLRGRNGQRRWVVAHSLRRVERPETSSVGSVSDEGD